MLDRFQPHECRNCLVNAGYAPTEIISSLVLEKDDASILLSPFGEGLGVGV